MDAPDPLLESVSPNGNVVAFVEQDENTCYFYLRGDDAERFGTKSCWVRNLRPAPEQLNVAAMREGVPPLLPRRHCRHPAGEKPLRADALEIIWSEEGDAAALAEKGALLAIIPGWSGEKGFSGYARDCSEESPLCWPLGTPETNIQFARYRRAGEYWRAWSEGNGPWPAFQDSMLAAIERVVGTHSNYYAIDGGAWPPKALLRVPLKDDVLLLTVGVSLRPMPRVDGNFEDPALHRRIELGMSLAASLPNDAILQIASYISAQSNLPWSNHTFLGNGHTVPADVFGELSRGRLSFALLQARPSHAPELSVPHFRGDPITYLWLTPISAREQRLAEEQGSAALATKLREAGGDWRHTFTRAEVA